jgi:basic membrane protein A
MNKLHTGLFAGIWIGLIVGASVAWVAKPVPPVSTYNKIGIVFPTSGLGDKSFNDLVYAGAVRARDELGIVFDYVEAQARAIAEYEGLQTNFAKSGQYALIVCVNFDQADALNKTARAYPNQNFVMVDMVVDLPNIASLVFKANEG